jgi:hypothetical protein
MGNHLAPILAILFLDRIENQVICADLSFYYRYIDDCIAPASSSEEARQIQNHLNKDSSIRYEIELPGEDGFPFLNTNELISIEYKEYVKYLGVLIDENLTWKYHIDNIASKISKAIGIIS